MKRVLIERRVNRNRAWGRIVLMSALSITASVFAQTATTTPSPSATALTNDIDRLFAELDATPIPRFDPARAKDKAYGEEHARAFNDVLAKRAELIGELLRAAPEDARVRTLAVERWRALGQLGRGNELVSEIDAYFRTPLTASDGDEAAYFASVIELDQLAKNDDERLAAIERYKTRSFDRANLTQVLQFATRSIESRESKTKVLEQIIAAAPESEQAARAAGQLRQVKAIGQPFELSFTDVITGEKTDIPSLKGKVIVIDFWATWCGPCRALVPELRSLYAAHHAEGLEIISISLDDAGDENVAKLKEVIASDQMTWRHFYAGEGFDSAIAKSWGIDSIPQLFLIDRDGKLVSTAARKDLEQQVQTLLK